jgi:SAM-dependent methyltransferase
MNENNDIFDKEYKLFEDRFRGSEAVIRQRLAVYLPLIAGVDITPENGRKALDLGSGRGEWLALISEYGWRVTGVEPNSIAEAARDIDAEIVQADALDYLRGCGDRSFGLVTAFHVVEHLETNYLLQMLREIRRVLTPGGLLILETPNPENLTVGTWSFHLDPTHKVPIPPVLLQYHAEVAGFPAPEIVRLNGSQDGYDLGPLSAVLSVLFRSSPDYAVVARTPGANDELFAALIKNFVFLNSQRNPADVQALAELTKLSDTVVKNHTELIAKLHTDVSDLREQYLMLQSALDQKTRELSAVYNSSSWRISRPFRILARLVRRLLSKLKHIMRAVNAVLLLFPPLKRRLTRSAESAESKVPDPSPHSPSPWSIDVDSETLADWMTMAVGSREKKDL